MTKTEEQKIRNALIYLGITIETEIEDFLNDGAFRREAKLAIKQDNKTKDKIKWIITQKILKQI